MKIENDIELDIFLKNIYILRKQHHKTKKEMSDILGISLYMLNKIEKGVLPLQLKCDIVFKIYKAFNIHPSLQFKKLL